MATYTATGTGAPITFSGLGAGTYTFKVTASSAAGTGAPSASSPAVTVGAAATGGRAPQVVPAVNGSAAYLATAGSTTRLKLAGCAEWGINDFIANNANTGGNNHANRVAACAKIASWGGNCIRLRVLADEYTYLPNMGSTATYLQWVRDWRDAAKAQGIYLMICAWDSLDSQHGWNNGGWANNYSQAFGMFAAIRSTLKVNGADDPFVFYEPFNEPNNVSTDQWMTAMTATIDTFRNDGYQGLLVLDSTQWSHTYDDGSFSALEAHDASRRTAGKHNLAFARHDYTDDYGGNWSYDAWVNGTGGGATNHVLMETEFGNQNGSNENASFSAAETSGFRAQMFDRPNIAGGTAFLFNWVDDNRMCDPTGNNLSGWGNDVVNWLSGVGAR